MSEQSPQGNSQSEVSMEERVMSLLDPQGNPETEPEEQVAETETQADSNEQPQETEVKEPGIPEAVEVEYEGKSYKVPPELKDALLRQRDYTVKTQETAEVRRNADTMLQQASKALELQKTAAPLLGKIAGLQEQIEQYERIDWNTLIAQDPGKAMQLNVAFTHAKDAKARAEADLQAKQTGFDNAVKSAVNAKVQEGHKALARDIKGWSRELGQKIMESTAQAYGAPQEVLGAISEPWAVRALHDAMQWRQLQASKPTLEKKTAPPPKTLKPQAAESRTQAQQSYEADRRALKGAKDPSERMKAAERLILRKLG